MQKVEKASFVFHVCFNLHKDWIDFYFFLRELKYPCIIERFSISVLDRLFMLY